MVSDLLLVAMWNSYRSRQTRHRRVRNQAYYDLAMKHQEKITEIHRRAAERKSRKPRHEASSNSSRPKQQTVQAPRQRDMVESPSRPSSNYRQPRQSENNLMGYAQQELQRPHGIAIMRRRRRRLARRVARWPYTPRRRNYF